MNALQRKAWCQIVQHTNGLALAGTLDSLYRHGAFELLKQSGTLPKGNSAYLRAALVALKNLGWLSSEGLTERGEQALEWLEIYSAAIHQDPKLRARIPLETVAGRQLRGHLEGLAVAANGFQVKASDSLAEELGWAVKSEWTDLGRTALLFAGVYNYPRSYGPLLSQAEELLFGNHRCLSVTGEEHLDRTRDLRFSAEVFGPKLARPFLDFLLPSFQSHRPPTALVDLGCGDGTVLKTLAESLPAEINPLLVGTDTSEIALKHAAEKLAETRLRHLVLYGDITEPAQLRESLENAGLDPTRVVFLTKSVIHNRTFRGENGRGGGWITSAGESVGRSQVENDLLEFFTGWRDVLPEHGMVVAEPYLVEEQEAARYWDRSLQPCLALTHAYSGQLLLPRESFLSAAASAGLTTEVACDLGSDVQGHSAMLVVKLLPGKT